MLMELNKSTIQERAGFEVVLNNVSKFYGRNKILTDLSCHILPGECVVLLGPNGAGKTTIFKLILGLTQPNSGEIRLENSNPGAAGFGPLRESIGFLPENVQFYDMLRGNEVLEYFARLKKVDLSQCNRLLKLVQLEHAADRHVRTYSKGMKQRLGLAQALLGSPKLLLLDEPTTGLDPNLKEVFVSIIKTLKNQGVTVVLSSHALIESQTLADQYAILSGGTFSAFGSLDQLCKAADISTRVRLQVPDNFTNQLFELLSDNHAPKVTNENWIEIVCDNKERTELIGALTNLQFQINDLEFHAPGLDDVYRHFVAEGGTE